jgi:hypothetical protein
LHEDFTLSGRYSFFSKNIVPQRIEVLNFHLSLQSVINYKEGFYDKNRNNRSDG